MRTRTRTFVTTAAVLAVAIFTITTTVSQPQPLARPAAVSSLPEVTLVSPGATGAGEVPVFAWEPVAGATEYRLTVVEQDGPLWAWVGTDTQVRFGGLDVEPPVAFGGPRLLAPGYWAVVALDAAGRPLAASGLRPVSPDGRTPDWSPVDRPEAPRVPVEGSEEVPDEDAAVEPAAPEPVVACDLLTDEEADGFLKGHSTGPGLGTGQGDHYSQCDWQHDSEEIELSVSINRKDGAWNPTLWAGDDHVTAEGLGEDSFVFTDWVGTRIGFTRDGATVYLTSGYGETAQAPMIELARLADARLQGQG